MPRKSPLKPAAASPRRKLAHLPQPPVAPSGASTAEVARLLGVSPSRISQLVGSGQIDRHADGSIDSLQAALVVLDNARRDDAGRDARARASRARAAATELRARRALRQYLTIDEVAEVFDEAFTRWHEMTQAESSRFYSDLVCRMPDDAARSAASTIYRRFLALNNAFRTASAELVKMARDEHLTDGARLDEVFGDLVLVAIESESDADEDDGEV